GFVFVRPRRRTVIILAVLACLLLLGAAGVADAYGRYSQMRTLATDGINHLHAVQALLPRKELLSQLTNPAVLPALTRELTAADKDFRQLRAALAAPAGTLGMAAHLPRLGDALTTAAALAVAADEACQAGLLLTDAAQPGVAWLKGGFFAKT